MSYVWEDYRQPPWTVHQVDESADVLTAMCGKPPTLKRSHWQHQANESPRSEHNTAMIYTNCQSCARVKRGRERPS